MVYWHLSMDICSLSAEGKTLWYIVYSTQGRPQTDWLIDCSSILMIQDVFRCCRQVRHHFFKLLLLLSHFSRVRLCTTPRTAAHQAPPSFGFSRQDHWSGLPFPSPMHESEVTQSCPTLRDPMGYQGLRLQPTRLLHPWDFPGKSTGVGCHCLSSC